MEEKIRKLEEWQISQSQRCAMRETRAQLMEQTMCEIKKDIAEIKQDVKDLINSLDGKYVSRIEFKPVQSVVYGMVGFILLAVLGAIVSLIIVKI